MNTRRLWLRADHRAAAAHAGVLARPRHRAPVRRQSDARRCQAMSLQEAPARSLSRLWLGCEIEPVLPRRDIKPENIFFDDKNNLRLGDFGLAINETCERPTARVGTLDYMSPEARCLHSVP